MAQIDIVIVNWNSGDQLRECLDSIALTQSADVISRIVVVDNASTDGSLDRIRDYPIPLTVVNNRANRGFAAACNQGARESAAEYVLFLNPDTRLHARSLSVPLAFLTQPENRDAGICGVQLVDAKQRIVRSCAAFPTTCMMLSQATGLSRLSPRRFPGFHMNRWDHATTRQVDHVIGAFFMVRRTVFDQLDGFDEKWFRVTALLAAVKCRETKRGFI